MSNFIPLREAMKALGVSHNTLRRYADKGEIPTVRLKSGHRRFDIGSFVGQQSKPSIVCYCRVSSAKQKDDLARQVIFMRERYPQAEIITDVGSGLNFKRKGLKTLLGRFLRGDKLTIVVAHRDRLVRFGFELFQYLCAQNGGELLVLDNKEHSPETELTQDLLAILHVFSCRMHGLRKYSTKIKEDSDIPKRRTKKSV
jgi:predicted site-specific integrase-resolvase